LGRVGRVGRTAGPGHHTRNSLYRTRVDTYLVVLTRNTVLYLSRPKAKTTRFTVREFRARVIDFTFFTNGSYGILCSENNIFYVFHYVRTLYVFYHAFRFASVSAISRKQLKCVLLLFIFFRQHSTGHRFFVVIERNDSFYDR